MLNIFNLTELPKIVPQFKQKTKKTINEFITFWENNKTGQKNPRLEFYNEIKTAFLLEKYLDLPDFLHRKTITKLRCSDHSLEIEKGRHSKTPREARHCKLCDCGQVETEEYFLLKCHFFDKLKDRYLVMQSDDLKTLMTITDIRPKIFGEYLIEALETRNKAYENCKL